MGRSLATCLLPALAAGSACSAYDPELLLFEAGPGPAVSEDSGAPGGGDDASRQLEASTRDAQGDELDARADDLDARVDAFDAQGGARDAQEGVLDGQDPVVGGDARPDTHPPPDDTDAGEAPAEDAGPVCVDDPSSDSGEDCCPDDPDKTQPGVCGCGEPDSDSDEDGTLNCVDECPDDPDKTQPGDCGCGVPDLDSDEDGTADCVDECPADAAKTRRGICGCGIADDQTGCIGLRDALAHRYRFDGTGTVAVDSAGGADGTVVNTELTDTGDLQLAGTDSDQYVDLENGLVSGLVDATFEVWLTWEVGDSSWQRIFDFGDTTVGTEGLQGTGDTYLMLTPRVSGGSGFMRAAYSEGGPSLETQVSASSALPTDAMHHVVVVIDDTDDRMALYLDGALEDETAFSGSLSQIGDINNWLGRSQYSVDPELGATLHEFRIYDAALEASQIQISFSAGPDAAFFE